MRITLLTTALLIVFASATAAADVYSWRDANGVVHYGDKPQSEDAQRIEIKSQRTNRTAVQERYTSRQENRAATSEDFQTSRASKNAQAAAAKLTADEKAAACEKARERLKSYINARRLYRTNDKGEQVYLEASEINEARSRAEQNVADKCG